MQKLDEIIPENVTAEIETHSDVERSLLKILRLWGGLTETVPLGDRWIKGMMLLQPADKTLKPKEIPIDDFFHKIVMLRDRLRVLEQNINSNKKLSDEDKVNMQQYITRCYGSLTTFNVFLKIKSIGLWERRAVKKINVILFNNCNAGCFVHRLFFAPFFLHLARKPAVSIFSNLLSPSSYPN